mgnify:CR=1 FL=1
MVSGCGTSARSSAVLGGKFGRYRSCLLVFIPYRNKRLHKKLYFYDKITWMKYLYGLAVLCSLLFWSSCRTDFDTVPSTGNLEFSKDTVYLDTVFSNIGSSTYRLKVYNRSDDDVSIPSLRLGRGEESNYRLNVDGIPGKVFDEVQVLANDSIFIFIETTVDILDQTDDLSFLYTDQIQFDSGGSQQNVELVTLVQDAVFLYPELDDEGMVGTISLGQDEEGNEILIEGFVLEGDELNWTSEKPYVVYGYAAVPSGETLTVQAGARIHFHSDSGILVANEASMKVFGQPSNNPELQEGEVIFEGDRLEPDFGFVPGQWGTIWLTNGSTDHYFSHTTIKNSVVGLLMDGNDGDLTATLSNVQIYNSANNGILARNSAVYGENVVIGNSGQSSLALSLGGFYQFNHCTFTNYWVNSFRTFPTISIDNFIPDVAEADLVAANFHNCVIYGSDQREIGLFQSENSALSFNFNFTNSVIRFEDPTGEFDDDPNYNTDNSTYYTNCVLNQDPLFQNINLNNFNVESGNSSAENLGVTPTTPLVPFDLNNFPRANPSDAGAYETTQFPDEGGN